MYLSICKPMAKTLSDPAHLRLQALVYDILPPNTATTGCVLGLVGARIVVGLQQTTQITMVMM